MAIYSFEGKTPRIGKTAYVHEGAYIIGDVDIGGECWIGPGAIIRGDYGAVMIGPRTAVEEGCLVHAAPLSACEIGNDVTIGHGAIIHCSRIGDFATIGMGAILSIGSVIGEWCIIGEGSIVPIKKNIPAKKIALGSPVRITGDVTEEHQKMWTLGKKIYVDLCYRYREGLEKL
jgi:carbonic anhydrase/acetyltransferase-like protein (isoleucine patch superfamily)